MTDSLPPDADLPDAEDPIDEIDDEVSSLVYAMGSEDDSPEEIPGAAFFDRFFPKKDSFFGKTKITRKQAIAITKLQAIPKRDPEFQAGSEERAREVINDLLELYTSEQGESRRQLVDILVSWAGGDRTGQQSDESTGFIEWGLGADNDEEE